MTNGFGYKAEFPMALFPNPEQEIGLITGRPDNTAKDARHLEGAFITSKCYFTLILWNLEGRG